MWPKYHWVTVMSRLWYYHRYLCVVQVLLLVSFLLRKWWWSLGCACYMEGYYRNQWGERSERQKPTQPLITRWLWKLQVIFSMPTSRSTVPSLVIQQPLGILYSYHKAYLEHRAVLYPLLHSMELHLTSDASNLGKARLGYLHSINFTMACCF